MVWTFRGTLALLVCTLAVACSSSPSNPASPSGVVPGAVLGAHTPCHEDTVAPSITGVSASPSSLWPPNHKWWTVQVAYTATDACGVTSCSLSVGSDEPVNGRGDGNTSPDWQVIDADTVRLRAERAGPGDGRVYTITISCRDAAGNIGEARTQVRVAHDQRKK
jgi:hypothetical protein